MRHSEFFIGGTFWCGGRKWRCTDIGTRTVLAICLDDTEIVTSYLDPTIEDRTRILTQTEAEAEGWFNGPPYAVAESVFDEYDISPCSFDSEGHGQTSCFSDWVAGQWCGGRTPKPGKSFVPVAKPPVRRRLPVRPQNCQLTQPSIMTKGNDRSRHKDA
jgi:hypothetical protein